MPNVMHLSQHIQSAVAWDKEFPIGTPVYYFDPKNLVWQTHTTSASFLGANCEPEVFIKGRSVSVPCAAVRKVENFTVQRDGIAAESAGSEKP